MDTQDRMGMDPRTDTLADWLRNNTTLPTDEARRLAIKTMTVATLLRANVIQQEGNIDRALELLWPEEPGRRNNLIRLLAALETAEQATNLTDIAVALGECHRARIDLENDVRRLFRDTEAAPAVPSVLPRASTPSPQGDPLRRYVTTSKTSGC